MAELPLVTEEEADRDQAALFEGSRQLLGRVSNATRTVAHSPRLAQPLFAFMVALIRPDLAGKLDPRIKVLVILRTSFLNGCAYCVGPNLALGRALGLDDAQIAALEGDWRGSPWFDARERAAIAWAEALTERTYHRDRAPLDALRAHFDETEIVELTLLAGFFNFWNRFNDALGVELEGMGAPSARPDDPVAAYAAFLESCWWTAERRTP